MRRGLSTVIWILVSVLTLSCATSSKVEKKAANYPPLHLVLALDGVGFGIMKTLHDGGYFREFYQPAQMIASFPSISDPNWTRIMQAPMTESYTKAFFDISQKTPDGRGQAVGSLMNHLLNPPPYEEGFHFKAEGAWQHLAIMTWTQTSALYWLDALEKEFMETRGVDDYFAFIMNTDVIAHVQGERALLEYLVEVDKRLNRMRQKILKDFGYELAITLVSDHGNYWIKPVQVNFEEPLKQKGWIFADTLKGERDIGFVAPEIIAFGSFFCQPGQEKHLATDLSKVEGVHVALYSISDSTVEVVADGGKSVSRATIDPINRTVFYEVLKGQDPLGQVGFFKGKSLSWDDYFANSYRSEYPYSAVRVWEAFHRNSQQAASVLASPDLGRVFANMTLRMLTAVKGLTSTHGSLHQIESTGIIMSTREPYPPIRPDDFRLLVSLKSYQENLRNHLKQKENPKN